MNYCIGFFGDKCKLINTGNLFNLGRNKQNLPIEVDPKLVSLRHISKIGIRLVPRLFEAAFRWFGGGGGGQFKV